MHVRTAEPQDAEAIEAVRIAGWRAAYDGIVPPSYLARLVVDADRRRERMADDGTTTLVAVADDAVVGMAVHGPARDDDRAGGVELYALYVDPSRWRGGVGTALMAACSAASSLWVLDANTRARAFYGTHGFVPDGVTKVLDLDGPVVEVRLVRSVSDHG